MRFKTVFCQNDRNSSSNYNYSCNDLCSIGIIYNIYCVKYFKKLNILKKKIVIAGRLQITKNEKVTKIVSK